MLLVEKTVSRYLFAAPTISFYARPDQAGV
jgi:hypothetical protein